MIILVLNSGSSSLKYKLFNMPDEELISSGLIENIGDAHKKPVFTYQNLSHGKIRNETACKDHRHAVELVLDALTDTTGGSLINLKEIKAIGHRVVHGKDIFTEPAVISDDSIAKMKKLTELAPLHMPVNIVCIEECYKILPSITQVAHFDTSYYAGMPEFSYLYPVPYDWHKQYSVRRYGFHGISYQYVNETASLLLRRPLSELKLISTHLGNGASITAFSHGLVLDTSMGFTPLEGLMMGTRAGYFDPAVIPYLISKTGYSLEDIIKKLNNESGLTAISGIGRDMRSIIDACKGGNSRARLAFDMFVHTLRKYIGAYFFSLGGADAIIFTGGIGENSPEVREAVFENLLPLGIIIDKKANLSIKGSKTGFINSPLCSTKILVIPTNEELMIARETWKVKSNQ
ncbi:MAG: acetate kinase [Desulfobacteraceae bacterium]|nr:MAG: acetate kinase [Desulfobacteraceae bacterium]